jgi:tungstate transport system substrate-binding protein
MKTWLAAVLAFALAACARADAERERVLLAATHTVEDSGLLEVIIAAFDSTHPQYSLHATVTATGQALELGRQGDVDVLLVHSPEDERTFMEDGFGISRREVMESDFILLGPVADPAGINHTPDVGEAFRRLGTGVAPFVSRGDESGTHRKELDIWDEIGVVPQGEWYIQSGVGMADALLVASQRAAYILSDRPTFLALRSSLQLEILSEGDARLLNPYSVIQVRNAANAEGARAFSDWITGPAAQSLIANFGADAGRPVFRATAVHSGT